MITFLDGTENLGLPEAFSSVYYHMNWIKNITGLNGPDC